MFELIVLIITLCAGFFTGLLGIGGGFIIFPAFLYLIPALGFSALSVNLITGITTVQILIGSLCAYHSHRGKSTMETKVLLTIGIIAALGSLCGSISSVFFSQKILLVLFLFILMMALLSMTISTKNKSQKTKTNNITVYVFCYLSGLLAGAVGLGGAVLYIPILRYFFGFSTKECVSNVSFIVFLGVIMTFVGKAATSQIPYYIAIFTLIGSSLGVKIGASISKKLNSHTLKKILLIIIIITMVRISISVFTD